MPRKTASEESFRINQRLAHIIPKLPYLTVGSIGFSIDYHIFTARHRNASVEMHEHTWWDVCILRQGSIEYQWPTGRVRPSPGQLTVFPAGCKHRWRALTVPVIQESFILSLTTSGPEGETNLERLREYAISNDFCFPLQPLSHRRREDFWQTIADDPASPLYPERVGLTLQLLLVELLRDALGEPLTMGTSPFQEGVNQESEHARLAVRMQEYLRDHLHERITVESLEPIFGYSKRHLNRIFRQQTGSTIRDYLFRKRINAACDLLLNTDARTNEVAYRTGFSDVSYFCRVFREYTRLPPQRFKEEYRRT